jgi:hypothetical protein
MGAHIFVDNSNIFGGSQRVAMAKEGIPWVAVRVYYRHLFRLVEGSHAVITRVLAGSVPPGSEELWEYAKQGGYDTALLKKIGTDDGRLAEQGVDELLHLKVANVLLDHDPPQTLILTTGDGRVGAYGTGFVQQAERALKRGWAVEVWSWKEQLSRKYQQLAGSTGRNIKICELDPYYEKITFIKEGTYKQGAIAGRPVGKFP